MHAPCIRLILKRNQACLDISLLCMKKRKNSIHSSVPFVEVALLKKKASMQVHIATVDEGQKPFKCSICDDSFTQIGSMKRHIASNHEGQKAFKCHKFLSFFSTKWIFFNILTQCHQVIHEYCNNS